MRKIDCHCHIVNRKIRDQYFDRTQNYAIVMQFLDKFRVDGMENDVYNTVASDKRLFLCPCIDRGKPIQPQLEAIEQNLEHYQIVGIKIYLTYQAGRADDEELLCVYEFAAQHNLSVTFHGGSCALILPSDNDLAGSNAIYIKNIADRFPTVNFIVAHMDDPRYKECIKIVHNTPNMFTDFSGAYEPGTPEGESIAWAIDTFGAAIHQYPDMYKKILYGTDFCPPINLSAIDEYDYTIEKLFKPCEFEDIYFNNCLRAFPRLKNYIKGEL